MSNLVTVNSGSVIDGTLKAGRIAIATSASISPTGFYNMINPAGGYVFITDPKVQGYNDGPPQIFQSPSTLPSDILATINGLPDRRGSIPFDNVWDALSWVGHSGKYFILDNTSTRLFAGEPELVIDGASLSTYPQSGSIAFDLSGNDRNGTLINGTTWNENGYFEFDGTDDEIDFTEFQLTGDWTISYFYYHDESAQNSMPLGTKDDNNSRFYHRDTGTSYRLRVHNAAGNSVGDLVIGNINGSGRQKWGHIAYSMTSTRKYGWVNGQSNLDSPHSLSTTFDFNCIGDGYNSSGVYHWDGYLTQVVINNKKLTDQEVNQLYYGANIVTNGLVFATDAGNLVSYPKTGTTAYNLTGSNDLTLRNGLEFNSDYGGYFNSDGTNDGLDTPDASNLDLVDFTLEGWVWFNQHKNYGSLLVKGPGGSGQLFNYCFFFYQNQLALGVGDGSTFYATYVSIDYVPTNQWNHIMGTYDGTDLKFYVNGDLKQTTSPSITPNTNTDNLNVIQQSYPIDGRVAVARVYDRALTADEISQNYNTQYPRFKSSRDITKEDLVLELDAHNPDSYLSGTTWTDNSGNGKDGTLVNGPTYLTDRGGVINFDNTDDYVDLPNDLGYSTNSVSVFAWYKINGNPSGNYHIICGGQELEMSINVSHTYLRNGVYTSNGRFVSNDGNVSLNDGNYHFYGFTFDGSTKRAYIDGVQVGTQAVTGTLTTSFSNRRLGRFGSDSTYYANGNMGYYAVWDKVLSADEILKQYNTMKPQYSVSLPRTVTDSLALDVDFGNTTSYPRTGTTIYDRSGNGVNGTAYNGPVWSFTNSGIYDFDGTDDYIGFGTSDFLYTYTDAFTLEIWVNPDALSGFKHLIGKTYANYRLAQSNSSISFRLDANNIATSGGTLVVGEWTHIVASWNPTTFTAKVYQDGEEVSSVTDNTVNWTSLSNDFRIASSAGENYYFDGKVSNAKVYSRVLSPSEVLENYKSTRSRFGTDGHVTSNLQLYLDAGDIDSFDNSNTTWTDLTGQYNATLTNGPTFHPRVGGIINFDGTNDRADNSAAPLPAGQTQYTIEAVFKPESEKTQVVWEQNTSTLQTGKRVCMILISDGDGGFNGQNADRHDQLPYYVGEYQHWTITVDTNLSTNKIKMYINGELYNQGNPSGTLTAGADKAAVGVKVSTDSEYFDGDIPLVRVYDDVLTAAEVLQNYNSVKNRFGLD